MINVHWLIDLVPTQLSEMCLFLFPSPSPINNQECAFEYLKSTSIRASKVDGIARTIVTVFAALMSEKADRLSNLSMWHYDIVLDCFFQLTFCSE